MQVITLLIVKYDGNHICILRHHVIGCVQIIVVVSGNVLGPFNEFSKCPVEVLGLFSFLLRFCSRI